MGTSWSTCLGSSAGAGSRVGGAVLAWSRRRGQTLTLRSTCIAGDGGASAQSRWREVEEWCLHHIDGSVGTLGSPPLAACLPARCGSSGLPADHQGSGSRSRIMIRIEVDLLSSCFLHQLILSLCPDNSSLSSTYPKPTWTFLQTTINGITLSQKITLFCIGAI